MLKHIDKFLKWLGTDRNTFATFILTLASIYVMVDRIAELLILFFTGIGVSYWGPITYTIALACPVFAFLFSGSSSFAKSYWTKVTFLYVYCISLYVVGISMAVQWINAFLWLLFVSIPNYTTIVSEFSNLIRPAFQAIAIYLPLVTFYPLFKWLFTGLNESKDIRDSINDYGGIDLSDKSVGMGPYTCENILCRDKIKGHFAKISETRRFDPALIVGYSGTGKTTMVFEPMMARDFEKKHFFKEVSKEMGFTALKTGIAHLNLPYDNNYLNKNFSLYMLTPTPGKESIYKAYMKKMIYSDKSTGGPIYRDLGVTFVSPDIEAVNTMADVARNYNITPNIIDPGNPNSIGLNPFIFEPSLTAVAISTVIRGMYKTNHTGDEETYRENSAAQAVENLSILLKVMYPRLHGGDLPNLEDMLKMLNNFDLVEDMCHKLEEIPELAEEYSLQLGYFKKNFYANSELRSETQKYVYSAITELDNLLRLSNVRNILCNRTNNIDLDKILSDGQITLVCTRRGDLGATAHKAFGLFFILLMQFSVLRRPGNEQTRIPHFLYVDDFADYVGPATESLYTIYRKYHVGTMISVQNLSQLGSKNGSSKYRDTIMTNATTKLVFGGLTREEAEIWEKEFNDHREWLFNVTYDTSKVAYEPKLNNPKWDWKANIKAGKLVALGFKMCAYVYKDQKGKDQYGDGKVDFMEDKYKEAHPGKTYDFARFTNGIADEDDKSTRRRKIDLTKTDYAKDDHGDIDPIKTDNTNSKYLFDNEDAIVFDLKKGNS